MKTAIVYASVHHGNTKKIVDEIAKNEEMDLIDATQIKEKSLSEYDLIGSLYWKPHHIDSFLSMIRQIQVLFSVFVCHNKHVNFLLICHKTFLHLYVKYF